MKKTLIAAATVAGLATAAQADEKRLVTIVTSPDAQTQLMSMVLTMQAGRTLEPGQVSAIVHLVASSVPELPTSNVSLMLLAASTPAPRRYARV